MIELSETNGKLIFSVRVVPSSSKSEIVGEMGGGLKIKLKAAPIDGAANRELIGLLAKIFAVSKNAVEIIGGQTSKSKMVKITGGAREVLQRL